MYMYIKCIRLIAYLYNNFVSVLLNIIIIIVELSLQTLYNLIKQRAFCVRTCRIMELQNFSIYILFDYSTNRVYVFLVRRQPMYLQT